MAAQTLLPERWIIVNDGSTDKTADIAADYAQRFPWIQVVHRSPRLDRHFGAKVHAFNAGLERLGSLDFDVIGNLDADISFDPEYLSFLMRQFSEDPKLGVAGTPFVEDGGYDTARDSFEGENHVAGVSAFSAPLFRGSRWLHPKPGEGVDWIAVTTARMKGWKTRSFPEKRFHHYRTLGTAGRSRVAASFSYGEKDYYLGGSPLWQLFRVAYRSTKQPLDGAALLTGYCWAAARRMRRPVSRELMRFHRREQMKSCVSLACWKFRKISSFYAEMGQQEAVRINESGDERDPNPERLQGYTTRRRRFSRVPTSLIGWRATVNIVGLPVSSLGRSVEQRHCNTAMGYRDGSRRSHDFLRSVPADRTTVISSPYSISNCGRSLRDGLRLPLRGDRRFLAARKRGSFSNRAQKVALP
jgi:glycosyltransferase involved in cell wall biosynthesis